MYARMYSIMQDDIADNYSVSIVIITSACKAYNNNFNISCMEIIAEWIDGTEQTQVHQSLTALQLPTLERH